MYIRAHGYYDNAGQQHACRAPFLLLLQLRDRPCGASNTFACVRKVALAQLGHFMMGRVNLGGKWHTVSGSYGNNGLPMTVDQLPRDAKPLPPDLYQAWNKGGGWNGPGSEAPAMRDWATWQFLRKEWRHE